jgi:hypothetical protein
VLRLLSGPAAHAGRQLVCLHGMGNCPTRCGRGVRAPGSHHVVRFAWSEAETTCANELLVVQGGDSSCEAEACRARRRLCRARQRLVVGVPLMVNSQLVGNKTSCQ